MATPFGAGRKSPHLPPQESAPGLWTERHVPRLTSHSVDNFAPATRAPFQVVRPRSSVAFMASTLIVMGTGEPHPHGRIRRSESAKIFWKPYYMYF